MKSGLSFRCGNDEQLQEALSAITPQMFRDRYADVIMKIDGMLSRASNHRFMVGKMIQPTFACQLSFRDYLQPEPISAINEARVLLKLGDSITTDHISPAG